MKRNVTQPRGFFTQKQLDAIPLTEQTKEYLIECVKRDEEYRARRRKEKEEAAKRPRRRPPGFGLIKEQDE